MQYINLDTGRVLFSDRPDCAHSIYRISAEEITSNVAGSFPETLRLDTYGIDANRGRPDHAAADDSYQRCATSITNLDPAPGPCSTNTRNGNLARTPSPMVDCPSKEPAHAI